MAANGCYNSCVLELFVFCGKHGGMAFVGDIGKKTDDDITGHLVFIKYYKPKFVHRITPFSWNYTMVVNH